MHRMAEHFPISPEGIQIKFHLDHSEQNWRLCQERHGPYQRRLACKDAQVSRDTPRERNRKTEGIQEVQGMLLCGEAVCAMCRGSWNKRSTK